MTIDVTDATFETEVIERSTHTPVVVDLWAPWCGPCRALGPILETVIGETGGKVVLAKVNVDENPQISQAFRVQSIPAVFAMKDRNVVDGFLGAQGEGFVRQFVDRLLPSERETELGELVERGDEASLRAALDIDPGHAPAVVALADLLVADGRTDEALELLERIPESAETRRIAALARTHGEVGRDIEAQLEALLDRVKGDDDARTKFLDLLEVLGPDHPRTASWRKALTSRLF
jgi:putative thioredoxin